MIDSRPTHRQINRQTETERDREREREYRKHISD